jgi:membrane protein implicated in regulation of membrane protease activity
MSWWSELTAFSVFLALGGIGFLFLLVSLVFGEVFDHLSVEVGHDFDHGGPSVFSTRVMAVFITAFGVFGAVAVHYGATTFAASGVGFGGGLVFGGMVYLFARFLYSQQASSEVHSRDLVGVVGRVVVAIPAGGVGQVRLQLGEELIDKIARAADASKIEENAIVRVDEVMGEMVVVART